MPNLKVVSVDEIPEGWMGLDIGPDSVKAFQSELNECKSVIWNGPMGVFEMEACRVYLCDRRERARFEERERERERESGDSDRAVEKARLADKCVPHLH